MSRRTDTVTDADKKMAADLWRTMAQYNPTGVVTLVNDIDAWTNYDADALAAYYQMPNTMFKPFAVVLTSRPSEGPKSCIFNDRGEILHSVYGVNGLSLLYAICFMLGVNTDNEALGRGSQAKIIKERLTAHLKRGVS